MGFSRQEYWSGLPLPPPGDLPNTGIEPQSLRSPELAGGLFTASITWEAPDMPTGDFLDPQEKQPWSISHVCHWPRRSGIGGATPGHLQMYIVKILKTVPSTEKNTCSKAWALTQAILFILTFYPLCPALCPGRQSLWTASSTSPCSLASGCIQSRGHPGWWEWRGERAAGISSLFSPYFGARLKLLFIK